MKYTVTVTINKDLETVSNTLSSREEAFKWMKGLKEFDLIEGEMNAVDSKYKMVFESKGKTQEMIETMKEFQPPKRFVLVYEMGGVYNKCVNDLIEENGKTVYSMESSFKFPFVFGLFAWMFKPMFKKQTLGSMNDLKAYIESK